MENVQVNSIDKKQNGPKYSKNDKSSTLPQKNEIRQRNTQRREEHKKKVLLVNQILIKIQ